MKGRRRELLALIEERPRRVSELAAATNMTLSATYEALREFKALGIVQSRKIDPYNAARRGGGLPHVYGLAGVDLNAFA